jgi:hypothetical protein
MENKDKENPIIVDLGQRGDVPRPDLDPQKLLSFAQQILMVLAFLVLSACGVLLRWPGSKEAQTIFEQARTILPPMVTLVLGFYFGGRHSR